MKTARRRFMVPIPKAPELDVLNERLMARCLERLDALRDLPAAPFEACEHVPVHNLAGVDNSVNATKPSTTA